MRTRRACEGPNGSCVPPTRSEASTHHTQRGTGASHWRAEKSMFCYTNSLNFNADCLLSNNKIVTVQLLVRSTSCSGGVRLLPQSGLAFILAFGQKPFGHEAVSVHLWSEPCWTETATSSTQPSSLGPSQPQDDPGPSRSWAHSAGRRDTHTPHLWLQRSMRSLQQGPGPGAGHGECGHDGDGREGPCV